MDIDALMSSKVLPYVEKPARYCGGELNMVVKDRDELSLMGVLCFPEVYDIGMSHYGSQILYYLINQTPQWGLARAYCPWPDAEKLMREAGVPLFSLEYREPLSQADWVGFSMQYELQFTNFLTMLDLANIPFYSKDRGEEHPIIMAGGPIMANPEPIAPFLDLVLIGDGEETLAQFCTLLERGKKEGLSKREILESFKDIEGAYIPSLYTVEEVDGFMVPRGPHVKAAKIAELKDEYIPKKQLVPIADVVHDRMAVEVMRGCTKGCRFCSAGMYYRPVREREVSSIADQISCSIRDTGWNEFGMLSLSTADYTSFGDLLCVGAKEMIDKNIRISLPSTRIDAVTEAEFNLLDRVSASSSLTIAPEAGSQRLRNVINKDFSRETIISMVDTLLKNNVNTLKLYFMVGLPTETEDDIDEMIELIREISSMLWRASRGKNLNVSVSPFSPKPHTPFQWFGFTDQSVILDRCRRIKNEFKKSRNVKIDYRDTRVASLESTLTRGDRSIASVILRSWQKGARFDGWSEFFSADLWQESFEECGVDSSRFIAPYDPDGVLPWDHISMGFGKTFFKRERERAIREIVTSDCRNGCIACGVCSDGLAMKFSKPQERSEVSDYTSRLINRSTDSAPVERQIWRASYRKDSSLRFLSHQNSVEIICRAFQAAAIPVLFSEGFRARPRIAFGPPLPLAACGEREFFDVTTINDGSEWSFDSVTQYLPKGFSIGSYHPIDKSEEALNAAVCAADWRIKPLEQISQDMLDRAVERCLSADSIPYIRKRKKSEVEVDMRPLILDCRSIEGVVEVRLLAEPGRACKPSEFLSYLFPEYNYYDFEICRLNCLCRDKTGQLIPL